ncbi:MAG: hypothetical protein MJ137_07175 [Clostridia bacterium]|nr:hypothetical protein [Clostridia bacterium]
MNHKLSSGRFSTALRRCLSALTVAAVACTSLLSFPSVPVSAATRYGIPAAGTLLYTMNFKEKKGWNPAKSDRAEGTLSLTATAEDPLIAEIHATVNSKSHNWGGEIEGLPLNDYTGYTVFFTIKRSKSLSEKDPNLGVYIDGYYGFYGYSTNLRLLNDMNNLGSHGNVNFSDLGVDIAGNTWESDGVSIENYAIEVNGSKKTIKVFIMDTDAKYVLVDSSAAGEISSFHTENLGLWFHQYNTDMPVLFGNFTVWKGCILTNDRITPAPVTTAAESTTDSPDTSAVPDDTVPAPSDSETGSAQTEAVTDPVKGCAGLSAFPAVFMAIIPAAAILRRKKH